MRLMLIVPRYELKLLELLKAKFAGDAEVLVMQDRRAAQRRKRPSMRNQERRRKDRRGGERDRLGTFLLMRTEEQPKP